MSSLVEKVKEKVRKGSTHRRSGSLSRSSIGESESERPYTTEKSAPAVPQVPAGYTTPGRTSVDNRRSGHFGGDATTSSGAGRPETRDSASRHNRNVSNVSNNDYGTAGSSPTTATYPRDTTTNFSQPRTAAGTSGLSGAYNDGYAPTSTGVSAGRSQTNTIGTPINEETRRLGLEADMARMSLERSANKPAAYPAENAQRFSSNATNGTANPQHEHLRLPPGFHITNEVRTYVDEHQRPAVTQEQIIKQRTEIIQEAISRDIHVHHYYTYVQPIKVIEVLPARHYHHDHKTGIRREIAAPEGWVMPTSLTPGVPDYSSYDLRGYERHYLVNDEHPQGILEDFIHPGREGKQDHHLHDRRHVSPSTLPAVENAFPSGKNSTSTERSFNTAASNNSNYVTTPTVATNNPSSSGALAAARSAAAAGHQTQSTTVAPHTSNLANRMDPRFDSDLDGSRSTLQQQTVGGRTPSNTVSSGYGAQPITGSSYSQTPIQDATGSGYSNTVTSPSITTTTRVGNRI